MPKRISADVKKGEKTQKNTRKNKTIKKKNRNILNRDKINSEDK